MKITYLLPILTALLIILFYLGLPDLKTVPLPRARDRRMTRRDVLFITLLTLIYAGVAFWNLGDTRAPQTVRSLDGESALIDLGGEETVSRVQIYTGIGQGSYTFELSPDGETWLAAASFEQGHAALLKWQELDLSSAPQTTARYLRITGSGPAELGGVAVLAALTDESAFSFLPADLQWRQGALAYAPVEGEEDCRVAAALTAVTDEKYRRVSASGAGELVPVPQLYGTLEQTFRYW